MAEKSAVTIRAIDPETSTSDIVELMTGWSPFPLWRCDHVEGDTQCREMAEIEVGSRADHQLCSRCAKNPAYRRYRVRTAMDHSAQLRAEFQVDRQTHAALQ